MFGLKLSYSRAAIVVGIAALGVAACDKETTAPVQVAASNVVAPVTAATVAAVTSKTFSFPSGAALSPALANQPVSLTFSQTGSTTTAAIQTPAGTAQATVTFGSCIFTITVTAGTLTAGTVITVPTCSITFNTAGQQTGTTTAATTTMTLGSVSSNNQVTVTVSVATNGTVTVTNASGTTVGVGTTTTTAGTGSGL